jgi:anti-sigma B factor antagonist
VMDGSTQPDDLFPRLALVVTAAVPMPLCGTTTLTVPLLRADGCVRVRETHGGPVVELHGEIDIATTSLVTAHLDAATRGRRPSVVIDLRAVTFIDCAGLGPISRAARRARERGGLLSLVCDVPRTLHILQLTGLTPPIPLTALLPTALRPGA